MKYVNPETITLQGLEEWAKQPRLSDIVGEAGSSMHCPVSEYVQSLIDEAVVVSVDGQLVIIEDERIYLDPVFEQVVEGIDDLHEPNEPVTARMLLRIIQEVA